MLEWAAANLPPRRCEIKLYSNYNIYVYYCYCTLIILSVTINVFVDRWKKAVSPKPPTDLNFKGPRHAWSKSLNQGAEEASSGMVLAVAGKPKTAGGRLRGNDHCPF